jgi:hypothetical protein
MFDDITLLFNPFEVHYCCSTQQMQMRKCKESSRSEVTEEYDDLHLEDNQMMMMHLIQQQQEPTVEPFEFSSLISDQELMTSSDYIPLCATAAVTDYDENNNNYWMPSSRDSICSTDSNFSSFEAHQQPQQQRLLYVNPQLLDFSKNIHITSWDHQCASPEPPSSLSNNDKADEIKHEIPSSPQKKTASSTTTSNEPVRRKVGRPRKIKPEIKSIEKNHKCPDCPLKFLRSHDLKRHLRSCHSDWKPHRCKFCGKYFARSDSLRKHLIVELKKIEA